ncbi:uncharacterized protein LOC132295065 [Cornus florida]|uniref:uncharacterized protein LOC132295065 n=1 Tax=Cornus florida TaxID=4283 RepID=UPI0028A1154D|nr:uncharacterized protein LOC132295065 [Cornus florida]
MAALSIGHSFHSKNTSTHQQLINKKSNPRFLVSVSCQSRVPINRSSPETEEEKEKGKKQLLLRLFVGVEKLGNALKENLSPKQKGDWKDLVLMSLSFAVYIYISQKIVCAYCAWTSLLKQPW